MIALLGATGYIGRSLARLIGRNDARPLTLYARDPAKLQTEAWPDHVALRALDRFDAGAYALVINAIGAGDPARVAALGADILEVTRVWDRRVLTTMGPGTRYVFLSSGAVYGNSFEQPAHAESQIVLPANRLGTVSPYTASKLYAEIGHRYASHRAILDVRVFGYADPAIALDGAFFLAELARSVVQGQPFATTTTDMVRDYAGALELKTFIDCWEQAGAPNAALDLYTQAPVSKRALLALAAERYGIAIHYTGQAGASPTGAKSIYASAYKAAADLGYAPTRDAAAVVLEMLDRLAAEHGGVTRRPCS